MKKSPSFAAARIAFPWRATSPWVWLLHLLSWAALLAACWQLNRWTGMERWLRSPWPMLHHGWLPLLALLFYALGWFCTGLWQALRRDPSPSLCPEIDDAWDETLRLLKATGIDFRDTPLFLVLGPWTAELRALLESAGASCLSAAAPLQTFVRPEAIFLVPASFAQGGIGKTASSSLTALHRLCLLSRRDRPGQHALQGLVLAMPFEAVQSDAEPLQTIARCRADLRVVRDATSLECPLFVAFAGLADGSESAPDGWFQRFALLPDGEPEERAPALKEGIDQMVLQALPRTFLRQMRLDAFAAPTETLPEAVRDNMRHYRFLSSAHAWRARLCRLLLEASANEYDEPGPIVGCYFLPSPSGPARQALVGQALWNDLHAHRNCVAWTAEARTQSDQERRITRRGYGLVVLGWLSALAMAGWFFAYRW